MADLSASRRITPTGWNIRWDEDFARRAYADGWWQPETVAHALHRMAQDSPDRILILDGDIALSAAALHAQANGLAQAMLARFPPGSVISFMLPNWHEAAIIYMGATIAGMVVNPILPSLRDNDLRFILADVGSRMIFIPARFRGHDYRAMLDRVAGTLDHPRNHRRARRCQSARHMGRTADAGRPDAPARRRSRRCPYGYVYQRHHRSAQGRAAQP